MMKYLHDWAENHPHLTAMLIIVFLMTVTCIVGDVAASCRSGL
jgi:hypothetical protein